MNKILLYSILLFTITACNIGGEKIKGNGNITSETRSIATTDRIKIRGAIDVFINTGEPSVRVEADENLLPYIEIRNNNGWLEVKERDNTNLDASKGIKVYVSTRELKDIEITGSGNATTNGKFTSNDQMTFTIAGSGDINADINAPAVNADIKGSGNIDISGETKNVDIEIKGSGNFKGFDLKAENAKVKIAGSGDADVFAEEELKIRVAGSGNVKYKGKAEVESNIAGSGTIIKGE